MNTCQRELYRVINTFLGRSKDKKPKGLCLTIKVRHVLLAQENMPWSIILVYLKNYTGRKSKGSCSALDCANRVTQVSAGTEIGMVGKLGFCLLWVLYEVEKNCLNSLKPTFSPCVCVVCVFSFKCKTFRSPVYWALDARAGYPMISLERGQKLTT